MGKGLNTGITGQGGPYLAEPLVGTGYRMIGMTDSFDHGHERIALLADRLGLVQGDLRNQAAFVAVGAFTGARGDPAARDGPSHLPRDPVPSGFSDRRRTASRLDSRGGHQPA
jgi:nucleoside-diphosphate-sugar epimerase